jgi:hypothetical protein
MKKSQSLEHWKGLAPDLPLLSKMVPIPYKATGSRYGACGVRIDGTPEFIDAVLSRLKELIDGENHITRLELARSVVDGSGIGKSLPNAADAAEVCYVRLHVRGSQGAAASAFFDRHLKGATERFAAAHGITEEV